MLWCSTCHRNGGEQEDESPPQAVAVLPLSRTADRTPISPPQPKGADRKQKTDREKMEKRTPHEKEKYQPSYETTILTEVGRVLVRGGDVV